MSKCGINESIHYQYPVFAPDFLLSLFAVMIEVMGSTAIACILAVSVCPVVCVVFPKYGSNKVTL